MGSVSRKYRVHLPSHWGDNSLPRPLLLDYHGWTEHAGGHEDDGHDFFAVADEDEEGGFLLVTPEGMGDVGEGRFGLDLLREGLSLSDIPPPQRKVGAAGTFPGPRDLWGISATQTGEFSYSNFRIRYSRF